jgi:hypothetical protein
VTEERNIYGRQAVPQVARRRETLGRLAAGFFALPLAACADSNVASETNALRRADDRVAKVTLVVNHASGGPAIESGYTGFSYEKSSLTAGFFTESNQPLVRLFSRLGRGLLRLGGNTVDRTNWGRSSAGPAAGTVGPANIDELSTFLQATGWTALYGINLATNSPAQAAEEARYVARALGRHLYAFEIGNEPDAYSINHLRPPSYAYGDFLKEWTSFAAAVQSAAPHSRLSGPASAWHETSWTVPFARDEGQRIVLLTQHYYRANGLSPQSTLALLLAGDPALPGLLDPLRQASEAAGIKDGYRLTEANSFYDGGAPHISNTFGTALWAIDFLFATARHGSSGVNFHGGGESPGYTPIADDGRTVVEVRPEYYGMLLFSLMGPGHLVDVSRSATSLSLSAYALAGHGRTSIMLVNKEAQARIDVEIMAGPEVKMATLMTLSAPALDSISGVTLNGAPIEADGSWSPGPSATVAVRNGSMKLAMEPATAVLVTAASTDVPGGPDAVQSRLDAG